MTDRDSGIELLKIIAMFFIVISHVVQTLGTTLTSISYHDYVLDYSIPTMELRKIL